MDSKQPIVSVISLVNWEFAKRMCLRTVGLKPIVGKEQPTRQQKLEWLMSEHSHIKCVQYCIDIDNLRQWVGVHLLRHPFTLPFICSQRSDRCSNPEHEADKVLSVIKDEIVNDLEFDKSNWRDYRLQGSTNNHSFVVNAQTLINMSRKRLCCKASPQTIAVWKLVHEAIREQDKELADVMVPNCVYRGFCPEKESCGFAKSSTFAEQLTYYRGLIQR